MRAGVPPVPCSALGGGEAALPPAAADRPRAVLLGRFVGRLGLRGWREGQGLGRSRCWRGGDRRADAVIPGGCWFTAAVVADGFGNARPLRPFGRFGLRDGDLGGDLTLLGG